MKKLQLLAAAVFGGVVATATALASMNYESPKIATLEENLPPASINWEVDSQICILKLQAYKTHSTGSTYYLLDIRPREQILHAINVPGRQKPIKELGAPVRTMCADVGDEHYTYHHFEKSDFVKPTDKSETNRLWGTQLKHLDQMGLN